MICSKCDHDVEIGEYPFCPHERVMAYHPFKPYFDIGLGEYVSSFAERETIRKRLGLEWKDQPTEGDLNARKDWANEQRKLRST